MNDVIVWDGWLGGIAIGLYMVFQYWMTGHPLGVSTGYGNVCAIGSQHPFFSSGKFKQPNNWRLWFIIGIPLGGAIAAFSSGASLTPTFSMGAMYEQVMPAAVWARALVLIGGGILIGYGARMAGGCTSGHSITGLSLLNPPSLVASAGFFIGGIVAVQLIFRIMGAG